jgi:hypothetical protein
MRPLLQQAGLTREQIEDRSARLDVKHQVAFPSLAADALGDDLLGFHLALDFDLREIGLLYYVASSSDLIGRLCGGAPATAISPTRDCRFATPRARRSAWRSNMWEWRGIPTGTKSSSG